MAFYIGGLLTAAFYAYILEWKRHWWDPDWVWFVAAIGVALTGCWVQAYTLWSNEVPTDLTGREAMVWINWVWVRMFLWMVVPIIGWQIIISFKRRDRVAQAVIRFVSGRAKGQIDGDEPDA